MAKFIDKGAGFASGLKDLRKHINSSTISCGIISTIFGCTGPAVVTIAAANAAGFTMEETVSWIFGIYFFGGLLGVLLALYYKVPISGAYSIPGASMMGAALAGYTFQQAAGAFIIAGVIVLIVGMSGAIGKIMKWLPLPIVMGMVGGCMMRFGAAIVTNSITAPIVCASSVLAFLIVPRITKKFPGVLAALIVGVVVAAITGQFTSATIGGYIPPQIVIPSFDIKLIISCSIPLAILVMGAENAQAMGVLKTQGYEVPSNSMTFFSGIGGIVSGLFGAHNANVAGPMTAICSSNEAGPKEGRYAASVINGITFALFGVVGSFAIAFVSIIPSALVSVLAGLAMINVLIQSLNEGFKSMKFKTGAFAAFVVGIANQPILGIGAAFWALVIGVVVALICDAKDFKQDTNAKDMQKVA